jgi:phospholipid/cholesterol/gamma-HCH transport system substrate-binding protein
MITKRVKAQLLVFVIITLLGVSYVGARYAKLDRVVLDRSYTVTAHYKESGGIFTGAEVTYRGVDVGRVSDMVLTRDGVDVKLDIDNKWDRIPTDTVAVVGNRSAVGEQYVELQPQVDPGQGVQYLGDGGSIDRTEVPIATQKFLGDIVNTVDSVNKDSLRTTVHELGRAFDGTGPDLERIIDTGTSFIKTADANFGITRALIRNSNTVLGTQVDTESSLREFASGLSAFSTALAGHDADLRRVIGRGGFAANQLKSFLDANGVDLGTLIKNVVLTNRVVVKNLNGAKWVLAIYPYAVGAGYVVVDQEADTHLWDARFGLVIPPVSFTLCHQGYGGTRQRGPNNGANWPLNTDARCTEPITKSDPRGLQNLRRVAPDYSNLQQRTVASYDPATGKLTWGAPRSGLHPTGTVAPPALGRNSWTWMYLQPLLGR